MMPVFEPFNDLILHLASVLEDSAISEIEKTITTHFLLMKPPNIVLSMPSLMSPAVPCLAKTLNCFIANT